MSELPGTHYQYTCDACRDTEWIEVEVEGVLRTRRCACWERRVAASALTTAHLPERFHAATLDTFVGVTDSQADALRAARHFVQTFPAKQKGLLLAGASGIGKTHLAAAVLKACIVERGARGKFFHVTELLRALRDSYTPETAETEASIMTRVFDCDVLVLDELGAEKSSAWTQETLGLVVNTRYNDMRPVIITTNLADDPDTTNPNALLWKIGARAHSRLKEMCEWFEVEGADARIHGAPSPRGAKPEPISAVRPTDFRLSAPAAKRSAADRRAR